MKSKIVELFGIPVESAQPPKWLDIVKVQRCPYLDRTCLKNRKSEPHISIGTCTLRYGEEERCIIICPHRLLDRNQVFTDCLHLLTRHEPGNELHLVPEISIPGGSVDYFLASARDRKVKDFVGIELQTLDTTGTVWPERQRLLAAMNVPVRKRDLKGAKTFGMNWKMTAKTILVQLHHKAMTFQALGRHLVLVLQDHMFRYMRENFAFAHVQQARLGDSVHFHSYALRSSGERFRVNLEERASTDADGIAQCLGLNVKPQVELATLVAQIEAKIDDHTLLRLE